MLTQTINLLASARPNLGAVGQDRCTPAAGGSYQRWGGQLWGAPTSRTRRRRLGRPSGKAHGARRRSPGGRGGRHGGGGWGGGRHRGGGQGGSRPRSGGRRRRTGGVGGGCQRISGGRRRRTIPWGKGRLGAAKGDGRGGWQRRRRRTRWQWWRRIGDEKVAKC
jgi:hypothetical protein